MKLLVLDIDYTLFDHRSPAENPLELMRPCRFINTQLQKFLFNSSLMQDICADLHEFLSAVYSEYDIIIWSATRSGLTSYLHEILLGQLSVPRGRCTNVYYCVVSHILFCITSHASLGTKL